MPDQQELRPPPTFLPRNEVPGALHCVRQLDPFGLEPQLVQLAAQHLAHFMHTFEVERPAADIDRFPDQRDRLLRVRVDPCGHALLVVVE